MKIKFAVTALAAVALCAAILGAPVIPTARADEWNKKTVVTFPEDVQVPGAVLPAGTYVFKLADSESNRNLVQIFNADGTRLITTVLAVSDYRMEAPSKPMLKFDERPLGQPEALRAWFYPGDNYGLEFVYPERRAIELANANERPVLAGPLENVPVTTAVTIETVPPAPVVEAHDTEKPNNVDANLAATELPHTASSVPGIAFGGVLALLAAFALRRFAATLA